MALILAAHLHAQHPNDGSPLGMNLAMTSDWGTSLPWHDMFRFIRGWEDPNAVQCIRMWRVFEEEFAGQTDRLVKVLAGWSRYQGYFDYLFPILDNPELNPANIQPWVLAPHSAQR